MGREISESPDDRGAKIILLTLETLHGMRAVDPLKPHCLKHGRCGGRPIPAKFQNDFGRIRGNKAWVA